MAQGKTALVLSAGGMFGAYQAGAWLALSEFLRPDIVVGASIGSLNGWVIAGGCDPSAWVEQWRTLEDGSRHRFRLPRSPLQGFMDAGPFEQWVQQLFSSYQPLIPYGVVMTDLIRLKPCLVQTPEVRWYHLAASCAVFGLLPQRSIDGRRWSDGGLLGALPLWAAAEMGADRIVAIHVLKQAPLMFRTVIGGLRKLAPSPPTLPAGIPIVTIAPDQLLGTPRQSLFWEREKAGSWIDSGYRDAMARRRQIEGMF